LSTIFNNFKDMVFSNELLKKYDQVMADVAQANTIQKVNLMSEFMTARQPIFQVIASIPMMPVTKLSRNWSGLNWKKSCWNEGLQMGTDNDFPD